MRKRWTVVAVAMLLGAAGAVAYNGHVDANSSELVGSPWYSKQPEKLGDYFSFYFFNGDGDGIYRFGRMGKVLTERYVWKVSGGTLTLKFRNTGEKVRTAYRVDPVEGQKEKKKLTLANDPRENNRKFEYFRSQSDRRLLGAGWAEILHGNPHVPGQEGRP